MLAEKAVSRGVCSCETTDRFFVDKFPIYMSEDGSIVHFTFIDEGLHSTVWIRDVSRCSTSRLLRELTTESDRLYRCVSRPNPECEASIRTISETGVGSHGRSIRRYDA